MTEVWFLSEVRAWRSEVRGLGLPSSSTSTEQTSAGGQRQNWSKVKDQKVLTCVLCSLREAQALLERKTLAMGGRGDKMAAVLMKHIQKEKKKLVSGGVRRPPLQRSEFHARLPLPTGGFTLRSS